MEIKLRELLKVVRHKRYTKEMKNKVLVDKSDVVFLAPYYSKEPEYVDYEKVKDDVNDLEVLYIPESGIPKVKYYKGKFIGGNVFILTVDDKKLYIKWLCLYIEYLFEKKYHLFFSYGTPAKFYINKFLDYEIVVPPLKLQKVIAEGLLGMKHKQDFYEELIKKYENIYDYVLNELLTFDKGE